MAALAQEPGSQGRWADRPSRVTSADHRHREQRDIAVGDVMTGDAAVSSTDRSFSRRTNGTLNADAMLKDGFWAGVAPFSGRVSN